MNRKFVYFSLISCHSAQFVCAECNLTCWICKIVFFILYAISFQLNSISQWQKGSSHFDMFGAKVVYSPSYALDLMKSNEDEPCRDLIWPPDFDRGCLILILYFILYRVSLPHFHSIPLGQEWRSCSLHSLNLSCQDVPLSKWLVLFFNVLTFKRGAKFWSHYFWFFFHPIEPVALRIQLDSNNLKNMPPRYLHPPCRFCLNARMYFITHSCIVVGYWIVIQMIVRYSGSCGYHKGTVNCWKHGTWGVLI